MAASDVLRPGLVAAHPVYQNMRIQDLCRKMHSFYRKHKLNQLLQDMFQREKWPKLAQMPSETHDAYIRNRIELVPLSRIEGRIAAEGTPEELLAQDHIQRAYLGRE